MLDKTHLSEATTTKHTKLVKIVETVAFGLDRRVLIDHGVRQWTSNTSRSNWFFALELGAYDLRWFLGRNDINYLRLPLLPFKKFLIGRRLLIDALWGIFVWTCASCYLWCTQRWAHLLRLRLWEHSSLDDLPDLELLMRCCFRDASAFHLGEFLEINLRLDLPLTHYSRHIGDTLLLLLLLDNCSLIIGLFKQIFELLVNCIIFAGDLSLGWQGHLLWVNSKSFLDVSICRFFVVDNAAEEFSCLGYLFLLHKARNVHTIIILNFVAQETRRHHRSQGRL